MTLPIRIAPLAIALLTAVSTALGQPAPTTTKAPSPLDAFADQVGAIAEKAAPAASDYKAIAAGTLQLGTAARQSGQAFPKPAVRDALSAVQAGEKLNPLAADWRNLRQELEKLLEDPEPPPSQDQQQQQEQEQQDQKKNEDQQQGDSESSQQNQDSGEGSDSKPSPENQDKQQGEGEKGGDSDPQQNQDPSQQGKQGKPENSAPKPENGGLDGLDEEQSAPQLDEQEGDAPPKPRPPPTRTVGGAQDAPKRGAQEAVILQKLDQLKQQDSPGELYQILLEDQQRDAPKEAPSKKDW